MAKKNKRLDEMDGEWYWRTREELEQCGLHITFFWCITDGAILLFLKRTTDMWGDKSTLSILSTDFSTSHFHIQFDEIEAKGWGEDQVIGLFYTHLLPYFFVCVSYKWTKQT
jgi:hypothetical protein